MGEGRTLSGLRVAVTGATGFLGAHLARTLAAQGADVVAVVRDPARAAWLAQEGARVRRGDLTDEASLVGAFEGVDAVVANAALSPGWVGHDEQAFVEANVRGAERTLRATAAAGARRVVKVSTVAVYRTRLGRALAEDAPLRDPDAPVLDATRLTTDPAYVRSKAMAERRAWALAEALGLGLTVLRPGPLYGPGDGKLTARYARWMRAPVLPVPTARLPHLHAGDVALAAAGALAREASVGRRYNLAGDPVSIHGFLATWKRVAGAGPVLIPIPVPVTVAFDDGAARRELGFAPRSHEEGIADVLAWLDRR